MSTQKRANVEGIQKIMSSFKQFDKKLDKLQEDVCFHSETLKELRTLLYTLSSNHMKLDQKLIRHEDLKGKDKPSKHKMKSVLQPPQSPVKAQPSRDEHSITLNNSLGIPETLVSKVSEPKCHKTQKHRKLGATKKNTSRAKSHQRQ